MIFRHSKIIKPIKVNTKPQLKAIWLQTIIAKRHVKHIQPHKIITEPHNNIINPHIKIINPHIIFIAPIKISTAPLTIETAPHNKIASTCMSVKKQLGITILTECFISKRARIINSHIFI